MILTLVLQAKEIAGGHSFLAPDLGLDRDLSLTVTVGNTAARLLIVVTFVGSTNLAPIITHDDLSRSLTQVQALLRIVIEALLFILLYRRIHTRSSALVVGIGPPVASTRWEVPALHSIGTLLQVPDIVAARSVVPPEFPGCLNAGVGSLGTGRLDFDKLFLILYERNKSK